MLPSFPVDLEGRGKKDGRQAWWLIFYLSQLNYSVPNKLTQSKFDNFNIQLNADSIMHLDKIRFCILHSLGFKD